LSTKASAAEPADTSAMSGMQQWKRIRRANAVAPLVDILLWPLVVVSGLILKLTRRLGLQRLPLCRNSLVSIGVLPVRRHYYEPFFGPGELRYPLDQERDLPGIDWNLARQLAFLSSLQFEQELTVPGHRQTPALDYHFDNASFRAGDAEFLYQVIRACKPGKIIEVGSGQSTRMARAAIKRNMEESGGYSCQQISIEPYENDWLEQLGVVVLRQRLEDVDVSIFDSLGPNDLLFIDSSHVIRPQGDVVVEYLEIIPRLRPGVIVHVHDIFSPRDYPREWLLEKLLLWDEQYLFEAFMTNNRDWSILAALNFLKHREFAGLQRVCPFLTDKHEPASIYIQRN
jgi:hypothetical protein